MFRAIGKRETGLRTYRCDDDGVNVDVSSLRRGVFLAGNLVDCRTTTKL